jgi:hypothetical protein
MSRKKTALTFERLHELMQYDSLTGSFVWVKTPSKFGHVSPGQIAGTPNGNGYIRVWIDGVLYHAHRLAWLFVTGAWPEGVIDHINGSKSDNRFANLRDVSHSVNLQNRKGAQKNNKAGLLGAYKKRGKFVSGIQVDGSNLSLGVFESAEAAHAVYLNAKRRLHEGNTL